MKSASHAMLVAVLLFGFVVNWAAAAPASPLAPVPPTQPVTGPGGAETAFDQVIATRNEEPAPGFWIFTPADPHPGAAASLPVVLFLGGCCMADQTNAVVDFYRAWIDHLVRRGAIVLYPTYRANSPGIDVANFVRMEAALPDAPGQPHADWSRLTIVAHSYGGVLAADYAGAAALLTLPVPRALMLAMPGCRGCALPTNLAYVADATRVIIMVGIADTVVGRADAAAIYSGLAHIPPDHRAFVTVWSDHHGAPPLIADHALATTNTVDGAVGSVDALDWYGTWKLTDALLSCTFAAQDCQDAFGDAPAVRFMGAWSDGTPVTQLVVAPAFGTPTP